jgi:preprotein translocase subunit SecG
MEAVVLVIHLIVALGIIAVVLVQPSEAGGFLGNSGSMSNMMAPRRSVDALTRITTILAGCFFLTSLALAIIAEHRSVGSSILDAAPAATPPGAEKTAPAKAAEPEKEKPVAPISQ